MTRKQVDDFFDALHRLEKAVAAIFGEGWGQSIAHYVRWTLRIENWQTWNEMMSLYPGAEPADTTQTTDPFNQTNE